jgi:hypothetical protein
MTVAGSGLGCCHHPFLGFFDVGLDLLGHLVDAVVVDPAKLLQVRAVAQ